jgi:hypothetical protein
MPKIQMAFCTEESSDVGLKVTFTGEILPTR